MKLDAAPVYWDMMSDRFKDPQKWGGKIRFLWSGKRHYSRVVCSISCGPERETGRQIHYRWPFAIGPEVRHLDDS
jgi:hypothetical protein